MFRLLVGPWLAAVVVLMGGCTRLAWDTGPGWTAQEVGAIGAMDVPECVAVDPATGIAYVSNMVAAKPDAFWADDGTGFLSRLRPGGNLESLRWKDSTPDHPLHSPKGMCVLQNVLYVADNTRLVGYALGDKGPAKPIQGPVGQKLNDLATDGEAVYISDTAAGVVYRCGTDGVRPIKAPEGVNGITFFKGRMFAVSWTLHDVYELDPTGEDIPIPFGLAAHFTNLDGIEVLDDGTFVVSDFYGHKISTIAPDRRTLRTLVTVTTPADIGLDRDRMLLYVPQFEAGRVVVYHLRKE